MNEWLKETAPIDNGVVKVAGPQPATTNAGCGHD